MYCNAIFWLVRLTTFAVEMQKCIHFLLLRHIHRCQQHGTHSRLHVECPILLPDFNQIFNFPTHFRTSPQYQISRNAIQWEPC
jgi:hypothetical protein